MKKYNRPFSFRNSIEIETIEDFNSICQEIMFDLVSEIATDERYLVGSVFDDCSFNSKGLDLIERTECRLGKLAQKIFTDSEMKSFNPKTFIWC